MTDIEHEAPKRPHQSTGNNFWTLRSTHGRSPIFKTPEMLWDAACQYFEWVEKNPLFEHKVTVSQGIPVDMWIEKPRVMTLTGLCLFIGIGIDSWHNYRKKEDFIALCTNIETTIREQKFAGASAGLFNPMIIARDLGLREATTQEISGKDGGAIEVSDMSERDIARRIAFTLSKGAMSDE